jgi:hypothetical protein
VESLLLKVNDGRSCSLSLLSAAAYETLHAASGKRVAGLIRGTGEYASMMQASSGVD